MQILIIITQSIASIAMLIWEVLVISKAIFFWPKEGTQPRHTAWLICLQKQAVQIGAEVRQILLPTH